jgi:hypothetical protein
MSIARRGGVDSVQLISGGAGNPQILCGTVDPSAGGGTAAAEGSIYLRFVAAAGQEWLKTGAADTAWTLVSTGAVDIDAIPEMWAQQNVAATQTNVDLSAQVSTSFDTIVAIRAGSIRGLNTRFTAAVTDVNADAALVRVTKNGASGTLSVSSSSGVNPSGGRSTQAAGIDTFVAGDLLGIEITTLGTYTPATLDLEAYMDVSYS